MFMVVILLWLHCRIDTQALIYAIWSKTYMNLRKPFQQVRKEPAVRAGSEALSYLSMSSKTFL